MTGLLSANLDLLATMLRQWGFSNATPADATALHTAWSEGKRLDDPMFLTATPMFRDYPGIFGTAKQ